MSNKDIWIIFAPQEYKSANHRLFWQTIAEIISETSDVVVINVLADSIVSRIKGKKYRISDHKKGLVNVGENLYLFRPMTFIRPELMPKFIQKIAMKKIKSQLSKVINNFNDRKKVALFYDCKWAHTLDLIDAEMINIYFIYDEVYLNASNGKEIKGLLQRDLESCKTSDIILTMTNAISQRRKEFAEKTLVIGNGAVKKDIRGNQDHHISNSVAFIGNFRNWIDFDMLNEIIKSRLDWMFCFAGPIEENVIDEFNDILNNNLNTVYLGMFSKENIEIAYKMVDVVIVPYKNNTHIKSTRPIKIVESVFNQTPVVTVPMDGYSECDFIRFANSSNEFIKQIDSLLHNPVEWEGESYRSFVQNNTWESKANLVINAVKNLKM